jgi:excisionase family DNA binding protein
MPDTHTPAPILVSPRDAARALGISTRTLWTLTHDGRLPCRRIGRLVRYHVDALRAFAAGAEGGAR